MPPPYLMGAPFIGGQDFELLLDVDFTQFAEGFLDATSFHAQPYTAPVKTDLVFKRPYTEVEGGGAHTAFNTTLGYTVQTSPTTLVQSAAATQTDTARIGNRTSTLSKRGLVIEHTRKNYNTSSTADSARNMTGHWLTSGGLCTLTYPYADSPGNDPNCTHVQLTGTNQLNGYSPFINLGGARTTRETVSSWQKDLSGAGLNQCFSNNAVQHDLNSNGIMDGADTWTGTNDCNVGNGGAAWQRLVNSSLGATRTSQTPVDGTNCTGWGGPVAANYNAAVDYTQWEVGDFPTEAIPEGYGVAPADRLIYLNGSALLDVNGQLAIYMRLSPKFASTMQVFWDPLGDLFLGSVINASAAWYAFSYGGAGSSYAKIKDADKKLYVRLEGGTEMVSTNPIAFGQYEDIELFIRVGNNLPSVAKFRTTGATSWTDMVLSTISDVPSPGANPIRFYSNDAKFWDEDTGSWTSWQHHLQVYKRGAPAGIS